MDKLSKRSWSVRDCTQQVTSTKDFLIQREAFSPGKLLVNASEGVKAKPCSAFVKSMVKNVLDIVKASLSDIE